MFCNINDFYLGLKVIHNNEPYIIIENEFVKPGKGRAFNRVKMKNLFSDKIIEKVFKSSDLVEIANVKNINVIYLYNNNKFWYFMHAKNFEEIVVDYKIIKSHYKWISKQNEYTLTLWNEQVIAIILPNFVTLKIVNTDSYIKGHSISSNTKIAILNTGAVIKVPMFIQIGTIVKIDTRTGEYASRVK